MEARKRITILGTGFAALAAVKRLRELDAGRGVDVTVVAPRPRFVHLPSMIWIPSNLRSEADVTVELDGYFERMGVDFIPGEVNQIIDGGRTVVTKKGEKIANDGLIIASGSTYMAKAPGIEYTLNPCTGTAASSRVRDRIAEMPGGTIALGFAGNPNEPTAVRGGPMFEFLFGIHTQLKREKRRDDFKLIFFNPMSEPGKRLGPKAVKGLLAAMEKRGIETHLGYKIKQFGPDFVETLGGRIESDLTLFIPGMRGLPWYEKSGLKLSPGGFIEGDRFCRAAGAEQVYVAGDAGSLPGPEWKAKQGYGAGMQAAAAAQNLFQELHGGSPSASYKNELLCVVDTLDTGMWVQRTPKSNFILPPLRAMHYVKRAMEWKNLYPLRK
uniref:Putative FAD-dependent pyridine nucleotide-disulphide oxidoreductase n=1 Tax=Magnetococcus massalia (strain MO-1) TaxID=451514 RepID=A0A1S7LLP8_MAGMO|nr:putative FAD-dependent pyridine nucleotide-disulphide oxidoreductase [Candidatus Magnetococcus massalia]